MKLTISVLVVNRLSRELARVVQEMDLWKRHPPSFVIPPVPACRGTGAYPDFLLRGIKDGHVCGPGQPGPHEVSQRHQALVAQIKP
jgi:hypothetical protein